MHPQRNILQIELIGSLAHLALDGEKPDVPGHELRSDVRTPHRHRKPFSLGGEKDLLLTLYSTSRRPWSAYCASRLSIQVTSRHLLLLRSAALSSDAGPCAFCRRSTATGYVGISRGGAGTASLSGDTVAQQLAARHAITAKATDGLADVSNNALCPVCRPAQTHVSPLPIPELAPNALHMFVLGAGRHL